MKSEPEAETILNRLNRYHRYRGVFWIGAISSLLGVIVCRHYEVTGIAILLAFISGTLWGLSYMVFLIKQGGY